MDRIKAIQMNTIQEYAGEALNGYFYLTIDETHSVFAIVSIATLYDERIVEAGIVARLGTDRIIIEKDISNKPLVDALVQNGVAREQIILAYAGEAIPTTG